MDGLAQDQDAKQFHSLADKSRIYIYRESAFVASAVKVPISIDNKLVGQSVVSTFFVLDIAPGEHQIGCLATDNSEVNILVKKGEIAYVRNQATGGAFGPGCEIQEVTADVAQPAILKTKRARAKF